MIRWIKPALEYAYKLIYGINLFSDTVFKSYFPYTATIIVAGNTSISANLAHCYVIQPHRNQQDGISMFQLADDSFAVDINKIWNILPARPDEYTTLPSFSKFIENFIWSEKAYD